MATADFTFKCFFLSFLNVLQLDVSYNMPETEQEILTSSGNLEESIPLMCPFNVTVSLKPAAVMSVGKLLAVTLLHICMGCRPFQQIQEL